MSEHTENEEVKTNPVVEGEFKIEIGWKGSATLEQMENAQEFIKIALKAVNGPESKGIPDCIDHVTIKRLS